MAKLLGGGKGEQLRKPSWLPFLLMFSLALNLGSFGTLAYRRLSPESEALRPPPGPSLTLKELCRALALKAAQCRQFQHMISEHQQSRRRILSQLAGKRAEILALLKQEDSYSPEIQDRIRIISIRQGELEEEEVSLLWKWLSRLTAGQRNTLISLLKTRHTYLGLGESLELKKPGDRAVWISAGTHTGEKIGGKNPTWRFFYPKIKIFYHYFITA